MCPTLGFWSYMEMSRRARCRPTALLRRTPTARPRSDGNILVRFNIVWWRVQPPYYSIFTRKTVFSKDSNSVICRKRLWSTADLTLHRNRGLRIDDGEADDGVVCALSSSSFTPRFGAREHLYSDVSRSHQAPTSESVNPRGLVGCTGRPGGLDDLAPGSPLPRRFPERPSSRGSSQAREARRRRKRT